MSAHRIAFARRWGCRFAVAALLAGSAPLLVADVAEAVTVGAPSNATALAGNEDESAVAVNPDNTQQIAVMTNGIAGDAGLPLSFSSDGGATWTRTSFATGISADGGPTACCDPTLAWDDHGNLFVGYLQRTPRTIELFVTTDVGATFTNLGPVDTGAAGTLDQLTVVAGEDSVWVTWRDDSNGIAARGRSVTGAGTFGAWGAEQDVSTTGNFGDIAIGPNGEVMVAYQTPAGGEGPGNIVVHADGDGLGAGGFGAGVTATATNVGGFDFLPAQPNRSVDAEAGLAWDRSGGANNDRVYLVYTDEAANESNDFDIFVRSSTNDGATWSAPVEVSSDSGGTNSQMLPRIALDQTNGDVAVSYYDATADTGGGPNAADLDGTANNDVTLTATWSFDAGVTWATPVAVADAPTNGYNAATGGQQLGDYTGAAFHGGMLYPSWADSSNSTGDNPGGANGAIDVYVAAVRPRNDPPVVSVAPATGAEGLAIVLSGSASDPNGDALALSWNVVAVSADAGAACVVTTGGTPATPTIRCSDDGTYTATVTATGDASGPVSASNVITVTNANPVATSPSLAPSTIDEGQSATFGATFTDDGWNDTYTGAIDWGFGAIDPVAAGVTTQGGAGSPDAGSIGASRTYLDDGSFNVTGTVTDDDGGNGTTTAALTVRNVAPAASIDDTGTQLINGVPTIVTSAGTPVAFNGRSTDPGSDDLTLTWDWDDGAPVPDVTVVSLHAPPGVDGDSSPDGSARDESDAQTHTFADACFYRPLFASADDDGGTGSDDIAVVVAGKFTATKTHGYFKTELQRFRDHSATETQCLLDVVGFMSTVFDEVRNASTVTSARAVLSTGGSRATDLLDTQLLAAWLNFADGRVGLADPVDTNFDAVPDTAFGTLVAQAEAVRLNAASSRNQLTSEQRRLDSFNRSGI